MAALPQPSAAACEFAAEVRAGLLKDGHKTLPCRYLYDAVGTALFQAISLLPEYGLTRADDRIIRSHALDILDRMPSDLAVVELGSGTGAKTGHILRALAQGGRPLAGQPLYYPIDVSGEALAACHRELRDLADIKLLEADYLAGLDRAVACRQSGQSFLVLFLGSTIGNFHPGEAQRFLAALGTRLRSGDGLLLGTDLEKPETQLLAAYDDAAGVTAAFNLNLLARINRELGGDFVLGNFSHQARYDRAQRRVEMHLRARVAQRVFIRDAGFVVNIREGETIWTESSHKFRLREIPQIAARSGFHCAAQWVDDEWPFAESLLLPSPAAFRTRSLFDEGH